MRRTFKVKREGCGIMLMMMTMMHEVGNRQTASAMLLDLTQTDGPARINTQS